MPSSDLACRVCGRTYPTPPWGSDGRSPTFEICECCGVEWGYGDATPVAVARFRAAWEAAGRPWFCPSARPTDWDAAAQYANIPEAHRPASLGEDRSVPFSD